MCDCTLNRRQMLIGLAAGMAWLATGPSSAHASTAASDVTPEQALQWLKEGNARFVGKKSERPHLSPERLRETSAGQHPFATVLSCSDSRVPVEHLFDRGIGDLFVIRVAGNVADTDEIGTAEYGAGHLGTPVILVLGHTKCGAVTAVVNGDKVGGSIPKLVDNIIPAVERAKAAKLEGDALILSAIKENVRQSMDDMVKNSQELAHLVHAGKVKVVGAVYHLEDGSVEWL